MILGKKRAKELTQREPVEFAPKDPAWDGTSVRLRYITARERLDYIQQSVEAANGNAVERGYRDMVNLVLLTVVDERGHRAFSDDDYDLVADLPAHGLQEVGERAAAMSGLSLEADEKKSEPSPS